MLEVPVSYFYEGIVEAQSEARKETEARDGGFGRLETSDLIQAFYRLSERPRQRLLDLAKSLHEAEA